MVFTAHARQDRHHSRRILARAACSAVLLAAAGVASATFAPAALASVVPCSVSSLVSAITTANNTPGGGTLTLTSGCTYILTAKNNSTDGGTGLPVIKGQVTIQGSGATITRSGSVAFRLLDVTSGGSLTEIGRASCRERV